MRDRIIAPIAFSVSRIADEHKGKRARCKLMRGSGGCTRVSSTTEDAEVIVGGRCTKQEMMWGILPTGAAGPNVKKEGGGG